MPRIVSPTWTPRPTPCAAPCAFSHSTRATGSNASPSSATGIPCSKPISMRSGASGASVGETVSGHAIFGDDAFRRVRLLPADRRAPEAAVDGVGRRLRRHVHAALGEVRRRRLTREPEAADRRQDLDGLAPLGLGEEPERGVEPDLVVARARRAVGDGGGAEAGGLTDEHGRLHDALGADAQRVDAAPEDIALNEVGEHAVEQLGAGIDRRVARRAEVERALLDGVELARAEAAGVDGDGVDLLARRLPEVGDAERSVEAAAEGEDDGHEAGVKRESADTREGVSAWKVGGDAGSGSDFYAIAGRATGQGQSSGASRRWAAMCEGASHIPTVRDSTEPVNGTEAARARRSGMVALPSV